MSFFQQLEEFPDLTDLTVENRDAHRERLGALRRAATDLRELDEEVRNLCGVAGLHPDPWVRCLAVGELARFSSVDPEWVAAAVIWATHDPEDFVAFTALRTAGDLCLSEALRDLLLIVGNASRRLHDEAGKPVGIGHAVVLDAIARIVGSRDPELLEQLEANLFDGLLAFPTEYPFAYRERSLGGHSHDGMVYVPAGPVKLAIPSGIGEERTFDWSDLDEPWTEHLDGFWIDVFPATATEYDQFASSRAAQTHSRCHPREPSTKQHFRNTVLDSRFDGSKPATGIDWFDAYAYAASRGKRLPREAEWQRAAQGTDGRAYPWGPSFEPDRAQWVGRLSGCAPGSLHDWRDQLLALENEIPDMPVADVDAFDDASPFGVRGLSGNTWEWTGTNFFSRGDAAPDTYDRDALEVLYDWRSYPVIRGGTWTSIPELMTVAFRGRDLLTDRHFENGMRCVCDCPDPRGDTG